MLPTFVIGLREGLEASLIVGIIAAFLIQRDERRALRPMWIGVAIAIGLCVAVAVVLRLIGESLPFQQREFMEGILALLAVAGVTYMVIWMRRHSRELKGHLEDHAERALLVGSTLALVGMAFFAVLREGLETAIFMLAAFQSSSDPVATGLGAALGVAVAVGLGYGIYRGGVKINLSRFFRVTGFILVLVAGGLLSTAVHEFAEAGVISVAQQTAFSMSWLVDPGSVRESLLTGMLGLRAAPTVAEVAIYLVVRDPDVALRALAAAATARGAGAHDGRQLIPGTDTQGGMEMQIRRLVLAAVALAIVAVACSGGEEADVTVTMRDDGITMSSDSLAAGDLTFEGVNEGTETHEFEVFGVPEGVDANALPVEGDTAPADEMLDGHRRGRGHRPRHLGDPEPVPRRRQLRGDLQPARPLRGGDAHDLHGRVAARRPFRARLATIGAWADRSGVSGSVRSTAPSARSSWAS